MDSGLGGFQAFGNYVYYNYQIHFKGKVINIHIPEVF